MSDKMIEVPLPLLKKVARNDRAVRQYLRRALSSVEPLDDTSEVDFELLDDDGLKLYAKDQGVKNWHVKGRETLIQELKDQKENADNDTD